MSGSPPAPRPLVIDFPINIFAPDLIILRCFPSVLMERVRALLIPVFHKRLTQLQPAPPTPTTDILISSSSDLAGVEKSVSFLSKTF